MWGGKYTLCGGGLASVNESHYLPPQSQGVIYSAPRDLKAAVVLRGGVSSTVDVDLSDEGASFNFGTTQSLGQSEERETSQNTGEGFSIRAFLRLPNSLKTVPRSTSFSNVSDIQNQSLPSRRAVHRPISANSPLKAAPVGSSVKVQGLLENIDALTNTRLSPFITKGKIHRLNGQYIHVIQIHFDEVKSCSTTSDKATEAQSPPQSVNSATSMDSPEVNTALSMSLSDSPVKDPLLTLTTATTSTEGTSSLTAENLVRFNAQNANSQTRPNNLVLACLTVENVEAETGDFKGHFVYTTPVLGDAVFKCPERCDNSVDKKMHFVLNYLNEEKFLAGCEPLF